MRLFKASFVLGKAIPLSGHPEQRFAFVPVLDLRSEAPTFIGVLTVVFRCRHRPVCTYLISNSNLVR